MSLALPTASPSDLTAVGTIDDVRRQRLDFDVETIAARAYGRRKMQVRGRIVAIEAYRRTAASGEGADGATTCRVRLNGTTVQAANASFTNAGGNGLSATPALDTAHARWDGIGIVFQPGDVIDIDVPAIEAGASGPTGLAVTAFLLV